MKAVRRQSLTRRTLLLVAGAVAVIVLGATAVSYRAVFSAMEAMGQQLLAQYAEERAKREATAFLQGEANMQVFKAAFLERWLGPEDPDFRERFARTIFPLPDGTWRSRRGTTDPTRQASTWIRAGTEITPEIQRLVMLSHDLSEQFFAAWRAQVPSLYTSSPLQFNSGIAPDVPEWVWQIAPDFDQDSYEWGRLASVAHNPTRRPMWTGVLLDASAPADAVDPVAFATLCVPIDVAGRHLITLHFDIRLNSLLDGALKSERAGITHMIFRDDGHLIAHPEKRREITSSAGQFFVQRSGDAGLQGLFAAVAGRSEPLITGYESVGENYYAASRLRGPDWWFVSVMPRAALRDRAVQSAQWVLWTGMGSLAFVLGALALILRRQVERPIRELVGATRQIAAGEAVRSLAVPRRDELGELADSFNEMSRRVTERDAALRASEDELRALNQNLEQRIAARTLELRDSEARLRTLLDHSPVAIVTVDADTGRFVDGNEHGLRLLGVDRETLLATGPEELSPPRQPDGRSSREAVRGNVAEALAGGLPVFEWLHRAPDGREIACEVHLARLPASGRRLVVGTLLDVTLRKRTETELLRSLERERELGQLKSDFVSMVSHEFRTPLEVILSSSDILDRYFDRLEPERRRAQLDAIQRSVRRMAEMMESVLLLSRVEAGTVSCRPAPLELELWSRRLVDELESATNHVCRIRLEVRSDLGEAEADPLLLRHIFANLLSNAVKYSAPGAEVQLVLERDETGHAVFHVLDRGMGIPEADRARLFSAFHRGRNVAHLPGTGLGLVIVKRCVDLHGGRIRCESREGEGTTFVVRLPLFVTGDNAAPRGMAGRIAAPRTSAGRDGPINLSPA